MILLFGRIHGVPAEKGSVGILATSEAKFSASVVAAGLREERWHHPAHQVRLGSFRAVRRVFWVEEVESSCTGKGLGAPPVLSRALWAPLSLHPVPWGAHGQEAPTRAVLCCRILPESQTHFRSSDQRHLV